MCYANFYFYLRVEMDVIFECNFMRFDYKSDFRWICLFFCDPCVESMKSFHNGPIPNQIETSVDSIGLILGPFLVCLHAKHESTGAVAYYHLESDIKE